MLPLSLSLSVCLSCALSLTLSLVPQLSLRSPARAPGITRLQCNLFAHSPSQSTPASSPTRRLHSPLCCPRCVQAVPGPPIGPWGHIDCQTAHAGHTLGSRADWSVVACLFRAPLFLVLVRPFFALVSRQSSPKKLVHRSMGNFWQWENGMHACMSLALDRLACWRDEDEGASTQRRQSGSPFCLSLIIIAIEAHRALAFSCLCCFFFLLVSCSVSSSECML
ncbi:hypothetical protein BD289DRAFT_136187 [Coniella lustricola]|uniref:Secreted protein n=1 Tax=Coniella lustricola TaxID=2025994 RepID=A0A2T3AFG0_9PEZI|nr:hypothetical protein BD289DRAFT_136187 [Coniella lustricola]